MRMRTILSHVAVLLAVTVMLSGQTHPCDTVNPVNPTTVLPFGIGFCHNGKDPAGNPVTITKFTIRTTAAIPVVLFDGPLTPIGSASATGFFYYETPKTFTLTGGQKNYVITATSSGGTGPTTPFDLVVSESPPSSVSNPRIVR
jgi:hypothetical protein